MRLATSICAVLALLHPGLATAIRCVPEERPSSGSPLDADNSDVILVSFQDPLQQVHAKFARLMSRPITTWSAENEAFEIHLWAVVSEGRKPVFFIIDTSERPSSRETLGVRWFACSAMFLTQHEPDMHALAGNTSFAPPRSGCEAGHLTGNETSIRSFFWPQESATDLKVLSNDTLEKLKPIKRCGTHALGGCELRVACIKRMQYEDTEGTCEDTLFTAILAMFHRINVTVKLVEVSDSNEMGSEQRAFNTDIILFPFTIDYLTPTLLDIPLIHIVHDTFYSRVDAHRVVSLREIAGECWKIVASTVVLLALVVLCSAVMGGKRRSVSRDISDTALFLLAAVLATSADQPNMGGHAGMVRKALLGLWLAAVLPLSVYFRTEFTAIVTLRRPAYRIDTLQKLEDALDRRQVSPCVVRDTLNQDEVASNDTFLTLPSLFKKLQLAFARHGEEALVRKDLLECIQCASSPDRVCYDNVWLHPSSPVRKLRNVRVFAEHLKIKLIGFVMVKLDWLYNPLRRLFLAIQEQKLIDWDSKEAEYEIGKTEFEMSGLLVLLVIFHATSCLVLVLEVVVARYTRAARL